MKILIPTCRTVDELAAMVRDITDTAFGCDVIVSGLRSSASVNRNHCLDRIDVRDKEDVPIETIAIMLDDDIEGFYPGWVGELIAPLADPSVVMVSARLLNPDGSIGQTCSRCYDLEPETIEIKSNGEAILPTAAIAFRYLGIRFDESYIGSGYEDSDWCHQILQEYPESKFLQSNKCRLIHRNEMKNQSGDYWKHNVMYFWNKWRPSSVTA